VPQESVLGLVLYLLYMSDLPQPEEATMATFADNTTITTGGERIDEATEKLK